MKCILGKKLSMTQVFREDGTVVPVTRVQAGPCFVTQVRQENGTAKIQIGFGTQKTFRLNKAQQGHLKDINHENGVTVRYLKETESDQNLSRGDKFTVATFDAGEKVKVIGTSKGKGYAGVVKKYHFKGGPKTHGQSDRHRAPGSSGQSTTPGRVYKGKRMSGRMGSDTVTIKNLQVIDLENGVLSIIGLIPGPRGSLVTVLKTGVNKKFKSIYKPQSADEIANNQVEPDVIAETESVVEEQNSEVPSEAVEVKPDSQIDLVEVSDESSETPVEEAKAENAPSETEEVKEDVEETK